MGNLQTFGDVVGMLRRRAWVIALVTAAGLAVTIMQALNLPRSYESFAVIQIESPRVTDPMSRDAAGGPTSFRLQTIQQQLMSRENLLALIDRHDLDQAFPGLNEVQRVVVMREAISLQNVTPGQGSVGGTDVSAILIGVSLGEAQKAADVANDVAAQIIALGTTRELQRIDEALAFFTAEEARIAAEIVALEREVTAFKIANVESLPETAAPRRAEIARLEEAIRDLDTRRLELAAERATLLAGGELRTVGQRQLETLNGQIGLIDEQLSGLKARRDAILDALSRGPGIEAQLSTYARAQQQLQDQYAVTTRRLAEAETSRKLAENQKTERFSLLERAEPALYPTGSSRRKAAVMGAGMALMAGIAVAVLLELLHPVLRTAGQMERATGIRPVVSIPYVPSAAERVRRRTRRVAGLAALALAFVTVVTLAGMFTLAA